MAAVHAAAFPPGERWDAAALATLLADRTVFGTLHPEGAMALFRAVAGEAELLTIAAAPEARRRGLAATLMRDGMAEARRRGAVDMFLEVSASNAPAIGLYETAGFHPVGRRPDYYGAGRDALVMRGALGPGEPMAARGACGPEAS